MKSVTDIQWRKCRKTIGMGLVLILLTACSASDDTSAGGGQDGLRMIRTQFNFSLPLKSARPSTRMQGDVVQKDGTEDEFRGIDDVRLLCFNTTPKETTSKVGNMIEITTSGSEIPKEATAQDYSMCQEISIPVGTTYFGFYAHTADVATDHATKMKYGIIETVGLDKNTYGDNSGVRFKPVQICSASDPLGGSVVGQRLLDLLNELMAITVSAAAPNDHWATVNNLYLNEAYQRMTQLTTLSSYNVQTMLAAVNRIVNLEGPDDQGTELAAAITARIASCCTTDPTPTSATITLKDEYQGYPDDIHLPAGAARIRWDEAQGCFVAGTQAYGNDLNVASVNDYVYPMNLQYQVLSNIRASNNIVIQPDESDANPQYDDWDALLSQGYAGSDTEVKESTQSVAMVKQVEYAVGQMAVTSRLSATSLPDADGHAVDVSGGFTLKGYLVGGQRQMNYNFLPLADSPAYAIYSTDINGGPQVVSATAATKADYILGMSTNPDEKIRLALELVNDGDDFKGADGVIVHGATFYLVALLDPTVVTGSTVNQVFNRARATTVNLKVTSLASATYGLPNLNNPTPTVGISVNMSWSDGLSFDDEL